MAAGQRRRKPTRTDHLTTALRKSQEAATALDAIDLRTVSRGGLRDELKAAKDSTKVTVRSLTRALRQDRPEPILEAV